MSRVLPILFNTDMVRAILDERKTVTRRLIKLPKYIKLQDDGLYTLFADGTCYENQHMEELADYLKPPYQQGDILYIRETWCWCPCWDCGFDTDEHNCCHKSANKFFNHNKREYGCYGYKASFDDNEYPSVDTWHPSIHMPKEAARIWIKVKDVRVERLQDIDDEQAKEEGANWRNGKNVGFEEKMRRSAVERFAEIWNSTIKKSDLDRYGWDASPWVWVIKFERCEKPGDI